MRVFLLCWIVWALAGPVNPGWCQALPVELVNAIEQDTSRFMSESHIPGLSLAIGMDGQIVYEKGFGMADIENQVPAMADTVYRTASIAKPMTATAVLQLVEQGKLSLDGDICQCCPEFPAKEWPVCIEDVLSHQSGVRHYEDAEEPSGTRAFATIADSLELFRDDPLQHEPGTAFTYSTFGYSLLGRAIETASGTTYAAFMTEYVFAPAGMDRTTIDHARMIIPGRARGFVWLSQEDRESLPHALQQIAAPERHYNAALHDTSMKVPGGGLVSTAPDLVRFAQGWLAGTLVSAETREIAWQARPLRDGTPTTYGLGWTVRATPEGKVVAHSGGQAGTSTFLLILPEEQLVVAVMCNLQGVGCNRLALPVARKLIGEAARQ